jgi:hypothetical protein
VQLRSIRVRTNQRWVRSTRDRFGTTRKGIQTRLKSGLRFQEVLGVSNFSRDITRRKYTQYFWNRIPDLVYYGR